MIALNAALHISYTTLIFTVLALALRLWVGSGVHPSKVLADGWTLLAAFIVFNTGTGIYLHAIRAATLEGATRIDYKFVFALEIVFTVTITLAKLSLLLLYSRLFPLLKRRVLVAAGLCLVWFFVWLFVAIFQCWPLRTMWSPGADGWCMPAPHLHIGYEVSGIAFNIVVMGLPVEMIQSMRLQRKMILAIAAVYLVGGVVCVIGAVRIVVLYHSAGPENGDTLMLGMSLSAVELAVAVVGACLPTYGSLLGLGKLAPSPPDKKYGWRCGKKVAQSSTEDILSGASGIIGGVSSDVGQNYTYNCESTGGSGGTQNFPLKGVRVERTVDIRVGSE